MKKLAISSLILGMGLTNAFGNHHETAPSAIGIVVDSNSSTTVQEEIHYKKTTTTHAAPRGIVIIETDQPEQDQNPFEDPNHFESSFQNNKLEFRTKKLTLIIGKEGVEVNGDFQQWKNEERSMGVFNSAEKVDVEELGDGIRVTVNWARHVPPRYKDDILELSKDRVKTTEDVQWSLFDPSGDVDSNVQKLDSADKINNLISLVNPFLKEPYNKKLYLDANASYKERAIHNAITLANKTYRGDARDDILLEFFLHNYGVGFDPDEVIQISNATYRGDARDEILYNAAQAYLYFYTEEEIIKLSNHTYRGDNRDRILKLLARRKAGFYSSNVILKPAINEADLERSRYVSNLISTARQTTNSSSQNRILLDGFEANLDLQFSLTEVLKIARATTNSTSQNSILVSAAEHYQKRWSQEDFRILARATTNSSTQNYILEIASRVLIHKPGRFYDQDLKDEYRSDSKPSQAKVQVDIEGAENAEVDVRIKH